MLLNYKNEIAIFHSGGYHNTHFEPKRSGGNDERDKLNKVRIRRVFLGYKFYDSSRLFPPGGGGTPRNIW